MINSRKLQDLEPSTRKMAYEMIKACTEEGIDLLVTSTFRDVESQNELYAQGRTKPGGKVTNAKGGFSFHQYRCAFDVVPLVNGKAIWNDQKLWERIRDIGEAVGLESASRWKSFQEWPHFQNTNGLSVRDLLAMYGFGERHIDWSEAEEMEVELCSPS